LLSLYIDILFYSLRVSVSFAQFEIEIMKRQSMDSSFSCYQLLLVLPAHLRVLLYEIEITKRQVIPPEQGFVELVLELRQTMHIVLGLTPQGPRSKTYIDKNKAGSYRHIVNCSTRSQDFCMHLVSSLLLVLEFTLDTANYT
jgi:hypothetical protein